SNGEGLVHLGPGFSVAGAGPLRYTTNSARAEVDYERRNPPQVLRCPGELRLREPVPDVLDQGRDPSGDLLGLPPVLHRKAEADRYRRSDRAVPQEVRPSEEIDPPEGLCIMPGDPSKSLSPEDILVGGQAVIEGVMMRTPYAYAVAVRRADGSLEVKKEGVRRLSQMWKPLSWPVIRGFAVLLQSLVLGLRSLNFSFSVAMADADSDTEKEKKNESDKGGDFLPILFSMIAAGA